MTIREAIIELVKEVTATKSIRIGKAANIDKDKCTCDVDLGNGASLHDVKLKSVEGDNDKGLVVVPKDGTIVCAAMIDGVASNWTIIQHSEIESWQITTSSGGVITVADDGKVFLNGDDHKGLVKVKELYDRLKLMEDAHNGLVKDFNLHTHSIASTSSTATPASPSTNEITQKVTQSEFENENVQHGDGA